MTTHLILYAIIKICESHELGKPLHQRVIPETYVQLLFEYIEARGHASETVLGEPWPASNQQGRGGVAVEYWESLLETAERFFNDPLIGLHVGQTITARHLGILGSVLLSCDNLGAALQRYEHYQRLIFDVIPVTKRISADGLELVWDTHGSQTGRLVDETGFTVMTQFCRSLIRGTDILRFVHFTHAAPPDIKLYEDFFSCPVLFNQPQPVLCFKPEMLAMPLKSPDSALIAVLERHADELLEKLPQQEEIIERVRKEIMHMLRQGEPDVEQLSAIFNCSPRTLQRRLTHAGTNFRHELNVVRHELARTYLQDPRLQVVEIAMLLGYSEHSAFTRAYKEWTGKTPQEERR